MQHFSRASTHFRASLSRNIYISCPDTILWARGTPDIQIMECEKKWEWAKSLTVSTQNRSDTVSVIIFKDKRFHSK